MIWPAQVTLLLRVLYVQGQLRYSLTDRRIGIRTDDVNHLMQEEAVETASSNLFQKSRPLPGYFDGAVFH